MESIWNFNEISFDTKQKRDDFIDGWILGFTVGAKVMKKKLENVVLTDDKIVYLKLATDNEIDELMKENIT